MLSELIRGHRDELIARCRARVAGRVAPRPTPLELEQGIPLFLRELEDTLAHRPGHAPAGDPGATQHGDDLLRRGFTIAQVVHDYGDAWQAITELAHERHAPISTDDVRALNNAIAHAVSAFARGHERQAVAAAAHDANLHLGLIAQDLRSTLTNATLAFEALRAGTVAIHGSTGDALGHRLIELSDSVDRSLTEVRMTDGRARPERIVVNDLLDDLEASALLSAQTRKLRLTVTQLAPALTIDSDRQILSSMLSILLQNAFEYTRPHSHVRLHARATSDRVRFDIEDQCGGIPADRCADLLSPHGEHAGSGLGLCVRGAALLRGALRVRNQNRGCVFTVELPQAPS